MIDYKKEDGIHLVTMNNGANTICPDWQIRMLEILDIVEQDCGQGTAMVLTGVDKAFNTGVNLEAASQFKEQDVVLFGTRMLEIFRRYLILPCPTVAALNGHAFAGGAMLALTCDFRIMREDRGWICLSEVDVGVPILPPVMGVIRGKLPANTARDALLTGKRYAADEAIAAGFADGKASEESVLTESIALATNLSAKERGIFKSIKQDWFGEIAEALKMA